MTKANKHKQQSLKQRKRIKHALDNLPTKLRSTDDCPCGHQIKLHKNPNGCPECECAEWKSYKASGF